LFTSGRTNSVPDGENRTEIGIFKIYILNGEFSKTAERISIKLSEQTEDGQE